MPAYSQKTKEKRIAEQKAGTGINARSRSYATSRYSIQSLCGLCPEAELRHAAPPPEGRPVRKPETKDQIIKRLKIENELPGNFLSAVGRK